MVLRPMPRFQSALRAFARSDPIQFAERDTDPGFNPRSVLSHGATPGPAACRSGSGCFNPRSVLSHGATEDHQVIAIDVPVSIRAPCFRTERPAAEALPAFRIEVSIR